MNLYSEGCYGIIDLDIKEIVQLNVYNESNYCFGYELEYIDSNDVVHKTSVGMQSKLTLE